MGRSQAPAFTCACCHEHLPASALGRETMLRSGARSKTEAILVLPSQSLYCQTCEDDETAVQGGAVYTGDNLARNEQEAWELSGVQVDAARWSAYILNY